MGSEDDLTTIYNGDGISNVVRGYRPNPCRISSAEADEIDDLTDAYFDGYPQIIREESEPQITKDGYSDERSEVSPEESMTVERDQTIELRDGTELSANIYRPSSEKEVPALLAWGQWGKDAQEAVFWLREYPQPYQESPFWDGALEAGDTPYLVGHGFTHIIPDPRGIGDSEGGPVKNLLDLHNSEDIHDVIEWIADQPWCNGNVGMIGPSSYAFSQAVIGQNPPASLEALFPIAFWYPGEYTFTGMRDASLYNIFHGGHMYDSTLPVSMNDYTTPRTMDQMDEGEVETLLDEILSDPDVKYNSKFYSVFEYPMKDPIAFDLFIDEWFRPHGAPGDLGDIDVPNYIGAVLPGGSFPRLYWEAFEAWEKADTSQENRMIVLPPGELARPVVDYHDEMVRWNDYQLQNENNGIADEPPVKTFVMGIDKWKFEREWPPERVEWTERHLHPDGQLTTEAPTDTEVRWQQPIPLENNDVYSVTFTESIDEDMEIIGPVSLRLEATIDEEDTNWIVDLVDVSPDGERQLVSQGWLRASFRGLDEQKAMTGWPIHTTEKQGVVPEETHEYAIPMAPTSMVIKEGHNLELIIRNQDDMSSQIADRGVYFLPLMRDVTHTLHLDGNSYLQLPITGRGEDITEKLKAGEQYS